MKFNNKLTVQELKEHLFYNEVTGNFTRLIKSKKVNIGDVAGTNKDGYININVKGFLFRAHRLAWLYVYGEFPTSSIDHINHCKNDNSIKNLRLADYSKNSFNRYESKANTSGQKGVSYDKVRNKYKVEAQLNGIKKFLGRFNNFDDACIAYNNFAKAHHGEFYCNKGIM